MPIIKLHFIYYAGFCSVNKNYLDNFYVPTLNTKFDSSKILPLGWAQFFFSQFFQNSVKQICQSISLRIHE